MEATGAILRQQSEANFYGGGEPLSVEQVVLDDPSSTEVILEIEAAGLCHSDLSVIDGTRPRPLPMLLGHEAAGRVLTVGSDVTTLQPGDRVVTTFLPRCGGCAACRSNSATPCELGSAANSRGELLSGGTRIMSTNGPVLHHLGISAFATHAVVDHRSVVRVDDDVPPEVAALLGCAVLTGGGAIMNAARAEAGDSVTVVGLGGIGMAAVLVGVALGLTVYGVDRLEEKRDAAIALGCTGTFSPDEAIAAQHQTAVVIEAVGRAKAFETAIALTAPGGRTVTVGLPAASDLATISPLELTAQSRSIIGSYLGSSIPERDIPRYVALWREGRLPVDRLITDRTPLAGINDALEELRSGRGIRHLITP